jgi:hypothetical protein
MDKVSVRHMVNQQVAHRGNLVTIRAHRMIEKSGGTNVTMVTIEAADGTRTEVSSRTLKVID